MRFLTIDSTACEAAILVSHDPFKINGFIWNKHKKSNEKAESSIWRKSFFSRLTLSSNCSSSFGCVFTISPIWWAADLRKKFDWPDSNNINRRSSLIHFFKNKIEIKYYSKIIWTIYLEVIFGFEIFQDKHTTSDW